MIDQGRQRFLTGSSTLFLIPLMVLALALGGCGKKKESVQTNPEAGATETGENLENVDLQQENFPGEELGGQEVEGEDVTEEAEAKPAVMLQDVFFDFDKYDLSEEARERLNQDARILRAQKDVHLVIEGHCDERGTVQYNLALGEKRAREVKDYLVSLDIDPSRIDIVSYGKEKPFALGHDEQSWAQNRRAHFVVR